MVVCFRGVCRLPINFRRVLSMLCIFVNVDGLYEKAVLLLRFEHILRVDESIMPVLCFLNMCENVPANFT